MQTAAGSDDRDRYSEANAELAGHIGDKLMALLRTPENQTRIQSVLDPIVSHIINRVFPYILLSAILFLILFILTIGTFWMVMRTNAPLVFGGGGAKTLSAVVDAVSESIAAATTTA
jgi:hypothetical protein